MSQTLLEGYNNAPTSEREPAGSGHIHITSSHSHARFSTSIASYPLKILSPTPLPSQPANVALAYTLAYGGGLVAGDTISLRVELDPGCGLILLTQGSTKVFKHRPGKRPRSHTLRTAPITAIPCTNVVTPPSQGSAITRQRMHVTLQAHSFLLLLPDSISPFRDSQYSQVQRFVLPSCGTASVAILDWVNSGRGRRTLPGLPEELEIWAMRSYASTNEVILGDKMIMRERMVLDNEAEANLPSSSKVRQSDLTPSAKLKLSRIANQLAPYNVYATLLLLGPHVGSLLSHLHQLVDETSQFQLAQPPNITWSFSSLEHGKGGVIRAAGVEVEDVRAWFKEVMTAGGVPELVGPGLWPRII